MFPCKTGRTARTAAGCALVLAAFSAFSAASAETTEYQVTFQSTWSAATHPLGFPPSPHFSGLIGGSHSDQVSFWNVGSLATTGIKNMAELGGKTALTNEVQAAITAGSADAVLSGGGISVSPGAVQLTFNVDDAFPLVTLLSMLAPSPDWFVGVSGLSLRENGAWIPELVVDLVAYDAGTDSGPVYTSPNQPTVPAEAISEITTGAFAGNQMVGTFTFVQTGAVDAPEGLMQDRAALVLVGPNPMRRSTRFQIRVPDGSAELAVYGIRGQLVRELFRGTPGADSRLVSWNGRDSRGGLVPSGVYFVALRGESVSPRTQRIVVTR